LSIFVDESGDFGSFRTHSPYYIVTLLFHDQEDSIVADNQMLDDNVRSLGFDAHFLHTGPIIRRENQYLNYSKDDRKKLLRSLLAYCQHIPIKYKTFSIEKKNLSGVIEMTKRLAKPISDFIKDHLNYFQTYDEIIVYYDNGQIDLTRILTSTLTALLSKVEFRLVKPADYKLFQLADMLCALELVAVKFDKNTASRSEIDFFCSAREFRRNYLRKMRKKRL
jgi:hypothetical protein